MSQAVAGPDEPDGAAADLPAFLLGLVGQPEERLVGRPGPVQVDVVVEESHGRFLGMMAGWFGGRAVPRPLCTGRAEMSRGWMRMTGPIIAKAPRMEKRKYRDGTMALSFHGSAVVESAP